MRITCRCYKLLLRPGGRLADNQLQVLWLKSRPGQDVSIRRHAEGVRMPSKFKCTWCYKDLLFYQPFLWCMFSHFGEKSRVICSQCQLIKRRPWEMKDLIKHACAKPIQEGGCVFNIIELPFDLTNVYEMSRGIGIQDPCEVENAYVEYSMSRRPTSPFAPEILFNAVYPIYHIYHILGK